MKNCTIFFFAILIFTHFNLLNAQSDSVIIHNIYTEALKNGKSYSNLDYLSNKIGGRLSGSPQAQQAVDWAVKTMKEAGADTVYLQECMVPHWVRGAKETGKVISTKPGENKELMICALGGSVGTPPQGITAAVIEVNGVEELEKIGKSNIEGKFVFFNEPMDPTSIETFNAYGGVIKQRWAGASEAVKYGAVGVIVRSCTLLKDDQPHTGSMHYDDTLHRIPACAISIVGAEWLSEHLKKNKALTFQLKMNCKTLPDEKSYNVVGEIRGSMIPAEYIVVGGHLDSWDTGKGAQDDGAGVVQSIEVIRIYKALGIRPKYSIRAVAFMNEENGRRGGNKYAELAKLKNEKHIAAIESDAGGFSPRGFSSSATPEIKNKIKSWRPLLEPYGVYDFDGDGSGVDIRPLLDMGVTCFELKPDSQRYFDYHHAATDTFETVNKRELELGGAAIAALVWIINTNGF
ncbi:MAG TPA: M20/M25/M40 family metallo-hydrolase [Bacteroidia bacterium]|nr:M20/M25/M40 family metallo-hydrolase [Bacteroidia bacterium]